MNAVTTEQARKLVTDAINSQNDPGLFTKRLDAGGLEPLYQWKQRALNLVLARLDTPDLPDQRPREAMVCPHCQETIPLQWPRTEDKADEVAALTGCRDHWKISFEHERANVIRLRALVARAHGEACICADCHITRHKTAHVTDGKCNHIHSVPVGYAARRCTDCGLVWED